MLVQGAKRQARHRISQNLYASYQQLQLPWLCPALHNLDLRVLRRRASTASPTSGGRHSSRYGSGPSQTRPLATLAESSPESAEDAIPFQDLTAAQVTYRRDEDLSRPIRDRNNIVVLSNQTHSSTPVFKKGLLGGISGDVSDVIANLHACVKVGRFERAAKLLRRLTGMYLPSAPELVDAHRVMLAGLLDALEQEPTMEKYLAIHRWFELDIKAKEVVPNAAVIALLLKAVMLGEKPLKQDRALRSYLTLANDIGETTKQELTADAISSDLFTHEEHVRLLSLLPEEYDMPTEEEQTSAAKASTPWWGTVDVSRLEELESSGEKDILPDIRAAEQGAKSLGFLKKSLLSMYELEEGWEVSGYSLQYLNRLREERLETDVRKAAIARWEQEAQDQAAQRARGQKVDPHLGSLVNDWAGQMSEQIWKEVKKSRVNEAKDRVNYDEHETMEIGAVLATVVEKQPSRAEIEKDERENEEAHEKALEKVQRKADRAAKKKRSKTVTGLAEEDKSEETMSSEEAEAKSGLSKQDQKTIEQEHARAKKLAAAALMAFIGAAADHKSGSSIDKRPAYVMFASIGEAVAMEMRLASIDLPSLRKYKALPSKDRRARLHSLLKRAPDPTQDVRLAVPELSSSMLEDDGSGLTQKFTLRLGAWFLALILKVAKLPVRIRDPATGEIHEEIQPAASHGWLYVKGKRIGNIRCNTELVRRLTQESVGGYISKPLPMLCEPLPWTSMQKGAYLRLDPISARIKAVRIKDLSKSQSRHLEKADEEGHMTRLYEGLNVLSKVPWRVNRPMLQVLIEAWNSGERIGKLAPAEAATYVNEKAGGELELADVNDRAAYRRHMQLSQTRENEIASFKSQRAYQNFQLEVARAFADEDTFYTPHNVDFRGRAYPIPPYFNHMGNDFVRSLFTFAKGKRLGDEGLRWLKIHVANQYGFDKEKLDDRVEFADNHLTDIYDSVENPLTGRRWWLTAGHPWQCLAACVELKSALDSPSPKDYVSHLPVQQDGTCNGLQHYAALGGDKAGAEQVNLVPGDKPADIYSAVKDVVVSEVHKAAEAGHPLAAILDGKITRKVVKQPVMTNVYGVTYHGAKEQVKKQLVDLIQTNDLGSSITYGHLSAFVAKHIFTALGRMFSGAQAIQLWLGECGARVSQSINPDQIRLIQEKVSNQQAGKEPKKGFKRDVLVDVQREMDNELYQFKSPIIWTTPLGMPVVQPYRASRTQHVKSSLQEIAYEEAAESDPVSKRKQLQAFPPNFIHSLDSAHMMLSAIKSDQQGLIFSSVHDSFWTHAADIPVMNEILRDAFVDMHSEDIVGRLREEMVKRYADYLHLAPIEKDSQLGRQIRDLRKANKRTGKWVDKSVITDECQREELLEEYERQRLLKSDDPEERKRGEEMVTPGSLYDASEDAKTLPVLEEKDVQMLGSRVGDSANAMMAIEDAEDADVPGSEGAEMLAEDDSEAIESVDEFVDEGEVVPKKKTRGKAKKRKAPAKSKGKTKRKASEDEFIDEEDGIEEEDVEEVDEAAEAKRAKVKASKRLHIWLPLRFPPTPPKGEFDVKDLKNSAYFFS